MLPLNVIYTMTTFDARDRIYGLHFSFTLSKMSDTLLRPFFAKVRLETLNQGGGKDFIFPAYSEEECPNVNRVDAQLPAPLCSAMQAVVVHIMDRRETTISHIIMTYHWLHEQRQHFVKKTHRDIYRTRVLGQKIRCNVIIRRMGSLVAFNPVDSTLWQTAIQEVEKENSRFQFWVKNHTTPDVLFPVLVHGVLSLPIYAFLVPDNTIDKTSFCSQGLNKFCPNIISPLFRDLRSTARIVEMIEVPVHIKLWTYIELLCGNIGAKRRMTQDKGAFAAPQSNLTFKGESDRMADHMSVMHLLYQSQFLSIGPLQMFADFLQRDRVGQQFLTLMRTTFPCVVLCQLDSKVHVLLSGLASKSFLKSLILRDTCDNFTFVATSPGSCTNDKQIRVVLIAWRDYDEQLRDYISVCLLQSKQDIDHNEFHTVKRLGVEMKRKADDSYSMDPCCVYSALFVRHVQDVQHILSPAQQLNASKVLRPILCISDTLNEIKDDRIKTIHGQWTPNSHRISWQRGWIGNPANKWESDHLQTDITGGHNIFVQYAA